MSFNEVLARSAHASAPTGGLIAVVSVATVSAALQLNVAAQLGATFTAYPRIISLKADGGKVWFFFNADGAGTVDETSTAPSSPTRCFSIDDGERQDWEWDGIGGSFYILTKAAAACRLRIAITSPLGGAG